MIAVTVDLVEQLGGETYHLRLCARSAADHAAPGWPVAIPPRRRARHPLPHRPSAPLRRNRRGPRPRPDQPRSLTSRESPDLRPLPRPRRRCRPVRPRHRPGGGPARDTACRNPRTRHRSRHPAARGGYRLDRGWAIAPGRAEPPFEGRPRDDLSGFACPDTIGLGGRRHRYAHCRWARRARCTLDPFGIAWHRDGEDKPFLRDRPTQAYLMSRKTGALLHAMDARRRRAPLRPRRQGRPARSHRPALCDRCRRSLRLRRRTVRPALQDAAVLHRRRRHAARTASSTTISRLGSVDLGCTLDNYHGLFRSYRAEDGDLDYYVLAGPTRAAGDAALFLADRRTGLRAALVARLRDDDSMTIADAPDADARISGFIAGLQTPPHSLRQLSLRLGLHLDRQPPLRLQLEPRQVPRSGGDDGAAEGGRHAAGHQPQAVPARRSSAARGSARAAASWCRTARPASRRSRNSGTASASMSTSPTRRAGSGGATASATALLDYGVTSVWNDNNEYEIWDEDAICDGDGRPYPQALARPAQPLLMTKLSYETAGRARRRASGPTRSRAPAAPASPATARPGPATTRPPGRRCATI